MAASGIRRMVGAAKDAMEKTTGAPPTEKQKQMAPYYVDPHGPNGTNFLTTEWGQRVSNTDDTLKAGERGPALIADDFNFRDKMTRFDHEMMPAERVVHARGSGAHGHFELFDGSLSEYTCAKFLTDTSRKTPVFVRFSTVLGFRGSSDTVRDVRGFATRFYTDEGNFDLVGNNIPIFFIQDGIKFPDVIHAGKPEPHWEIPQAQTAHDNFWDFISLTPETMHMAMWVLSDRAIPRSYRTMQGFGVNTYTLVNDAGRRTFVKFHWRPALGIHSLAWDEAQKLAGADPDFHRRDLWEAIEAGAYPEYEFGLQLIPEEDEHKFEFDILDATKFIPEELVPIRWVGKMVLNRNPTEFWAETEHIAFCIQNVVRGIDFSNDPLLQTRLFSYLDTQLLRFHTANFMEAPINQPICPVFNHNRRGAMRMRIQTSHVNYWPNRYGEGRPALPNAEERGYENYRERVEGIKMRARGPKFREHYRQAAQFYRSLSPAEKQHLIAAARFELGRCEEQIVRDRMIEHFNRIDHELAVQVAEAIGVARPEPLPAGAEPGARPDEPIFPSLAMERTFKTTAASRKVAILIAPGFNLNHVTQVRAALKMEGCVTHIVGVHKGPIASDAGGTHTADFTFLTARSILFDGIFVPGGAQSVQTLLKIGEAINFINEAYKHCKPIGALAEGINLLRAASLPSVRVATAEPQADAAAGVVIDNGVVTAMDISAAKTMMGTAAAAAGSLVAAASDQTATSEVGSSTAVRPSGSGFATDFIACLRQHRFWYRTVDSIPA